jgi:hypothetical protein
MPASKLAKAVGVSFLALTLVSVANREASAQVLVSGFTNGLFCAGTGCNNPNTASLQTTSILGTGATQPGHRLYYSNSQFSGLTSGNSVNFSNAASGFSFASGNVTTQNVNNFGAFYMGGGPGVTYASPFTLWITLTSPTNTGLVFTGALTGTAFLAPRVPGSVQLVFDDPTQGITIQSNGNWATVTIDLSNMGFGPEIGGPITGVISAHVTPEPMTLSLLGTGLLGLVGVARRRRRKDPLA